MKINKTHTPVVRGSQIYARASTSYAEQQHLRGTRWSSWEHEFKQAVDSVLLALSVKDIDESQVRTHLLQVIEDRAKRMITTRDLTVIDASHDAVLSYHITIQGKPIIEYNVTFCEGKVLNQSTPPGVHDERNDGQRHYREMCCTGRGRSQVHADHQRQALGDEGWTSTDHVPHEVVRAGGWGAQEAISNCPA